MNQDREMKKTIAEEKAVKDILKDKIIGMKSYSDANADILAYQLAEIIVLAKDLYIKLFPEIMKKDRTQEDEIWKQITGIRVHLLHLKDCIQEFDASLLGLLEDFQEE